MSVRLRFFFDGLRTHLQSSDGEKYEQCFEQGKDTHNVPLPHPFIHWGDPREMSERYFYLGIKVLDERTAQTAVAAAETSSL